MIDKLRYIRGKIIDKLPCQIRRLIIYKYRFKIPECKHKQKLRLGKIYSKRKVNILFIASSLSIWKYEQLLQVLKRDTRFNISIILHPFNSYSKEAKQESIEQLKSHFNNYGVNVGNAYIRGFDWGKYFSTVDPDIMFYPMPYEGIYPEQLEYKNHMDKLIGYIPYGIGPAKGGLFFNTIFHNVVWRIYVATPLHKLMAKKESINRGENVIAVGESNSIRFQDASAYYPWKCKDKNVKRIIWAPHYSIMDGHAFHRVSFLWLSEFMLNLAHKYDGKIQIAFKPHPKLKTLMYEHPDWGKEKTDRYYSEWCNGKYTLLEEGAYNELFATSDAMIHDSCSFIGEYMYTTKPVLFTSKNIECVQDECNEFGNACLALHYHASTTDEIVKFVNDVLLNGNDEMKDARKDFFNNELSFNDGLDAAERIYRDLLTEFGWDSTY